MTDIRSTSCTLWVLTVFYCYFISITLLRKKNVIPIFRLFSYGVFPLRSCCGRCGKHFNSSSGLKREDLAIWASPLIAALVYSFSDAFLSVSIVFLKTLRLYLKPAIFIYFLQGQRALQLNIICLLLSWDQRGGLPAAVWCLCTWKFN